MTKKEIAKFVLQCVLGFVAVCAWLAFVICLLEAEYVVNNY